MKTTLLLLIFYTVIDMLVCEVIEIKGPTETRHPNASAILDREILHTDADSLEYNPAVSKDPLNLTDVPSPINRTLQDKNLQSPNFSELANTRTPKNLYTSANLPSIPLEERQTIPARQPMYSSWDEMLVKPTSTTMDNKKSNKGEIYDTGPADANDRGIPLVSNNEFRQREEKRRNEGINRQYPEYDGWTHGPDEYYASPENYHSYSNYEPHNIDTYAQKHVSQSGRYGLENYNSYSTRNYKNNRYYQNSADFYSGSPDRWPPRPPHPNSVYSRFTVDSYDDPARGVPSPSLTTIFFAIGSNLVQLFKIGLGSGLSIVLSMIAIKLFLIPLKILKFIKIVKIILKLIFVVPFILRFFAPSIYSVIGSHDNGFDNKMGGLLAPESRDVVDQTSRNSTWWNSLARNLTSVLPDVVNAQKCPSRVACELGSYLASSSRFPEKLTKFIESENLEKSKDFDEEKNQNEQVTRAFLRAFTQRWTYDRCDVFACGISL